jgi:hypothetical protein
MPVSSEANETGLARVDQAHKPVARIGPFLIEQRVFQVKDCLLQSPFDQVIDLQAQAS